MFIFVNANISFAKPFTLTKNKLIESGLNTNVKLTEKESCKTSVDYNIWFIERFVLITRFVIYTAG